MTRLVVAIPHACPPDAPDAADRAAALHTVIQCLHELFGAWRHFAGEGGGPVVARPNAVALDLDIVVVTGAAGHVLDLIGGHARFTHHPTAEASVVGLGFAAQAVLQDRLGTADLYGYLEDDRVIDDALFFEKLCWISRDCPPVGGRPVLFLPLAEESILDVAACPVRLAHRIHPDTGFGGPPLFEGPILQAALLGRLWSFEPCRDAYAGCYFLNQDQMEMLNRCQTFLNPVPPCPVPPWPPDMPSAPGRRAIGRALADTFAIYRPTVEAAGFLAVRHVRPEVAPRLMRTAAGLAWTAG